MSEIQPSEPRTILVTGGAGFIGSNLVRGLLQDRSCTVVNVDKLTYAGNLESLAQLAASKRHHFYRSDIGDSSSIRTILRNHRPEAVMHLAAESHVDRSIDGPAAFVRTNLLGTFSLLQESLSYWHSLPKLERQQWRFIHVSTDEVYGDLGQGGQFSELSPYAPSSPYSATKAGADHLVRAWARTYGFPAIVTNCSNNYGPYQFPEKLIPLVILNGIDRKELPVYGRGDNVRDWLYVEDHVQALLAVLRRGRIGETYLIGGGNERSNLQVVEAIADTLDELAPDARGPPRRQLIRFVDDRPGHDLRYAIDSRKIRSELAWCPNETFDTGIRKTIEWYLKNEHWCERVRSGAYRGERLGLQKLAEG